MSSEAREKASAIEVLALDVDGVLTTGAIIMGSLGEELKEFSVRDGLGVKIALSSGLDVAVISSRRSEIVEARCKELGITHIMQGAIDKVALLKELASDLGVESGQVAFLGDDLVDLGALRWAGLGIAVADACEEVLELSDLVTAAEGGFGAAREAIEFILKSQGKWESAVERLFGAEG
jgi:3-deoxy-D-manno-octulosonate 8-phosphate phosphatase (KDO 8-P phosphatase)